MLAFYMLMISMNKCITYCLYLSYNTTCKYIFIVSIQTFKRTKTKV